MPDAGEALQGRILEFLVVSAPRGAAAKVRMGNLKAHERGVYHSGHVRDNHAPCPTGGVVSTAMESTSVYERRMRERTVKTVRNLIKLHGINELELESAFMTPRLL